MYEYHLTVGVVCPDSAAAIIDSSETASVSRINILGSRVFGPNQTSHESNFGIVRLSRKNLFHSKI